MNLPLLLHKEESAEMRKKAGVKNQLKILQSKISKCEQLFNMTDDGELIEAIIFEQNAARIRLSRLISEAKRLNISIAFTERETV